MSKIAWPHDDNETLIKFYGTPGMVKLRDFVPPFQMIDADTKKPVKSFEVHPKCFNAFAQVFQEIWDKCNHDQSVIEKYHLHLFGGSYNKRLVRGSTSHWSVHAFGAAIDINPAGAPMAVDERPTQENMPDFAVEAFKRAGATWGGDFQHRKDWMHFQFVYEGKQTFFEPVVMPVSNVVIQSNTSVFSNTTKHPVVINTTPIPIESPSIFDNLLDKLKHIL
jgi:hypothetical protein